MGGKKRKEKNVGEDDNKVKKQNRINFGAVGNFAFWEDVK